MMEENIVFVNLNNKSVFDSFCPVFPREVTQYDYKQTARLLVKPGITCIWQVSGRSNTSFEEQIEMDKEYVENRSLWLDFKILLKTIPAVLLNRGAE